jgi:subtilisin family serine protease
VKVLGPHGDGNTEDVSNGIRWAADHGARVINVSLGTFVDDGALEDAVAYARSRNAIVVAAAGNAPGIRAYPAGDAGALAVAGSDVNGQLYSWSNAGSWIQLAAPGSNITTSPNGSYADFVGTSAAAPVVSGIAAFLLSADPGATDDEIVSALEQTAHPTQGVSFGIVDAAAALRQLLATVHRAPASTRPGARASSRTLVAS